MATSGAFSSYEVVVLRGAARPWSATWWRSVVGSALAAGACRWRVRPSQRSFSGAVVVAGFRAEATALRFAAAWAGWCGLAMAVRVRASQGARVWAVSVPVAWPGERGSGRVAP
jgi:hypothetical protein